MTISLITVVLNRAETIGHTLQSVLNQTYKSIDYVIIDGGSTDGTINIIKEWLPKFNGKVTFVSEPDSGVYNAINKGISHCKGDIVGILHADDFFTSNDVLEKVANGFKDKWVSLVYGNLHYIDFNNPPRIVRQYRSSSFTPDKLRFGFAPPHPTMYCRRSLYTRYGLYKENYKVAADFEMFARLLAHSNILIKYIPIDMVTMRTGGLSTQWKHRLTTNLFEKLRALRENHINTSIFALLKRYYYIIRH